MAWRVKPPKKQGDKIGKVPVDPHTGRDASSTNPQTWGTLKEAVARAESDGLAGIGFVFTLDRGVVGIDLDHCRSHTTGSIAPWAESILRELDTYSEVSPSGTGVHALCLGKLPSGGRRKGKVEMYDQGRFFTFSGDRVPDTPPQIEQRAEQVLRVHAEHIGRGQHAEAAQSQARAAYPGATLHDLSDQALIDKARSASNGSKFVALWGGDHSAYASQSEADLALAGLLAFWTGGDASRIDGLFRASGLMRAKWDERRGDATYGQRTIEKALAGKSEFYSSRSNVGATGSDGAAPAASSRRLTDTGNSIAFAERFKDRMRYCYLWGKWLIWDGKCWRVDTAGRVIDRTKNVIDELFAMAARCSDPSIQEAIVKWALKSQGVERRKAMVTLAQSEEGIPIQPDELDRDGMLLNVANGTIDLRTGTLRPHDQSDFITRLVACKYDPLASCPTWLAFLEQVLPDPELRAFLQRAVGWSLTGDVSEQVLFFCYGVGANGKSTFLGAIQRILGRDYAMQAAPDLLLSTASRNHPTEIADLFGKRLAICMEVGEGRSFDEVLVKQLTGGDVVKARRMREDFWEFEPTHHLWISGNHKPIVRGSDHAIWRRVLLIPFEVTIPKEQRDGQLGQKLLAEAAGILSWAVEGCRQWLVTGLRPPAAVQMATAAYRDEMDLIALFLAERVVSAPGCRVRASEMYGAYRSWSEDRGERPLPQRAFGLRLSDKGLSRQKQGLEYYIDVQLATPKTPFLGSPEGVVDLGGPCGPGSGMNGLSTLRGEFIAGCGPQGPHGPNRVVLDPTNGAPATVFEESPAQGASPAALDEWGAISW